MASNKVLVIGATGLVGSQLIQYLIDDASVDQIICLVRRPITIPSKKVSVQVVNFLDLDKSAVLFDGVGHVFCCIGTTMKQAKSREQFQIVDHYIPKVVARIANDKGINAYSIVSSVGANADARSFYLSVKGKIEDDLKKVGFETVLIYRPSLLLGDRDNIRYSEIGLSIMFKLFSWVIPKRYQPTDSDSLAKLMVKNASEPLKGVHTFEPDMIL